MLIAPLIGILPVAEPRLFLVSLQDLERAVIAVTPLLIKVANRTKGDVTFPGIVRRLQTSEWQLWLIGNDSGVLACLGTQINFRDDGQKAFCVTFLSGSDMKSWLHLLEDLEKWALAQGCIRSTITARKGFARMLPDYRAYHVELEKDLLA